MITVEAKVAGGRRALIPRWEIPPPPEVARGAAPLTLRDLIARIVREEISSFRERQSERRLVRVLSEREIASGAESGRIHSGGDTITQEVPDEDSAVGVALQGFDDGLYFVFIDGRQYENLNEQVFVGPDSAVTFLRLVPLAGG